MALLNENKASQRRHYICAAYVCKHVGDGLFLLLSLRMVSPCKADALTLVASLCVDQYAEMNEWAPSLGEVSRANTARGTNRLFFFCLKYSSFSFAI